MKILMAGAGLANLSAAYHLKLGQAGQLECRIFEQGNRVGGLCRTVLKDGFAFDLTGHLLHFRTDYCRELVTALLGDNLRRLERKAWVYSHGRYIRYPFQANLHGLPPEIVRECVKGFMEADRRHGGVTPGELLEMSFKEWVTGRFGRGIARHFMIPYNRKLWTVDPGELTCDWMGRYVPCPTVEEVIAGAAGENVRQYGYNAHFWYPLKGGIQSLSDALAQGAGDIRLNKEVVCVDLSSKTIEFQDGDGADYEILVSAIPLKKMIGLCRGVPEGLKKAASGLRYASVLDINLGIDRAKISEKHWIYFPEGRFVFYRVGFPMNFSPYVCPPGSSSVYVEVALTPGNSVDEEDTARVAVDQLVETGLLRNRKEVVVTHIQRIPFAYAIYDQHRRRAVPALLSFLREYSVYSIGRYGAWEYSAMEDALLAGRNVAREIVASRLVSRGSRAA
ncbi:MAG: FAD-dependent oxidoreductase [Deltaproteobacteria bacterium]|nr:FAD-dependent oxidoreductase [Deltaproteobacteria bacterium]MBW2121316.1 FAD-dependent oxidoreductase [Deltaproteobacteria bacterium]